MIEIEKLELENIDEDIKKCFIKFENGGYPLGLPTQIQIARELANLHNAIVLIENKIQGHRIKEV